MLINEAMKHTGLTKKAIRYYIGQGLLSPAGLQDGSLYRRFSGEDIRRLELIRELRRIGLSAAEIKQLLNASPPEAGSLLVGYLARLDADLTRMTAERNRLASLLTYYKERLTDEFLSEWFRSCEPDADCAATDQPFGLIRQMEELFPGPMGRMLVCHFGAFLHEEPQSEEQRRAWSELVQYLDDSEEPFAFPEEAEELYGSLSDKALAEIAEQSRIQAIRLAEASDSELLEMAGKVKQNIMEHGARMGSLSPLVQRTKRELSSQGYYEGIPALMKRCSPLYARYAERLQRLQSLLDIRYTDTGYSINGSQV